MKIGIADDFAFHYIIIIACFLNLYSVVHAIYNKDLLLTSESYREHKTCHQIFIHILFRFIDISLRITILSALWLIIGFGGLLFIVLLELFIISYLAYYTKQFGINVHFSFGL